MAEVESDLCLLCGRALPRRKLWQRLLGLSTPTCRAGGLDEEACLQRFAARFGVDPSALRRGEEKSGG